MRFEELVIEIFSNFEEKHRDICNDFTIHSREKAERILSKYNTQALSDAQVEELKAKIIKKDVDEYMAFVAENREILDSERSYGEKLNALLAKYDAGKLPEREYAILKGRIARHIYDDEVSKTLMKLLKK
jgi:hypothetical protein